MSTPDRRRDRKLLLWLLAAVVLLMAGITAFTPRTGNDPRPSVRNTGSQGAKAIFLTLQAMHRTAVRWDQASERIAQLDPARTTLVLAEPAVPARDREALAERLKKFLERGGRVLITGAAYRASLLPGGRAEAPGELAPRLCETTPEGAGELAAAGSAEMAYNAAWVAAEPQFRVEQRCGGNAVVVRVPVGAGEAVWWSSATPLTNAGLKRDANLRLLLASLGEGRAVYFDEFYFGDHTPAAGSGSGDGRVLKALAWQFALLFGLLVWSFSRRKGPLRMPVAVPRSSPVEFAESMGGLYSKARATGPVVEAAKRRLDRLLTAEAGLSHDTVRSSPEAVAEALGARFGVDNGKAWESLRRHLQQARAARDGTVSPGDALALVRALADDEERLRAMLAPAAGSAVASSVPPFEHGSVAPSTPFHQRTASAVPPSGTS